MRPTDQIVDEMAVNNDLRTRNIHLKQRQRWLWFAQVIENAIPCIMSNTSSALLQHVSRFGDDAFRVVEDEHERNKRNPTRKYILGTQIVVL